FGITVRYPLETREWESLIAVPSAVEGSFPLPESPGSQLGGFIGYQSEQQRGHSPVHDEARAGDERRIVGEQKRDRRGDLVRRGNPGDAIAVEAEAELVGAAVGVEDRASHAGVDRAHDQRFHADEVDAVVKRAL